jgi:hypothetical protein
MYMKTNERSCTIPHNEGRRLRPNDTDSEKTGGFLVLFERGWRRRAVFWHVCAMRHAGQTQGRIHPDKKRRDVCATREIGEARKRSCGLARRQENAGPKVAAARGRRKCVDPCSGALRAPEALGASRPAVRDRRYKNQADSLPERNRTFSFQGAGLRLDTGGDI